MTIETKLDIGDEVFLIRANKIEIRTIKKIHIWVLPFEFSEYTISIHYNLDDNTNVAEQYAYKSKEELLKSL